MWMRRRFGRERRLENIEINFRKIFLILLSQVWMANIEDSRGEEENHKPARHPRPALHTAGLPHAQHWTVARLQEEHQPSNINRSHLSHLYNRKNFYCKIQHNNEHKSPWFPWDLSSDETWTVTGTMRLCHERPTGQHSTDDICVLTCARSSVEPGRTGPGLGCGS